MRDFCGQKTTLWRANRGSNLTAHTIVKMSHNGRIFCVQTKIPSQFLIRNWIDQNAFPPLDRFLHSIDFDWMQVNPYAFWSVKKKRGISNSIFKRGAFKSLAKLPCHHTKKVVFLSFEKVKKTNMLPKCNIIPWFAQKLSHLTSFRPELKHSELQKVQLWLASNDDLQDLFEGLANSCLVSATTPSPRLLEVEASIFIV